MSELGAILAVLQDIAVTNRALQAALAPGNKQNTEVIYTGAEAVGSSKTYNIGGKIGDIDNNLIQGRVYVYFDFHGGTNSVPNYVLDASTPGPRHFTPKNVGTITLIVPTGSAPPKGTIQLMHY